MGPSVADALRVSAETRYQRQSSTEQNMTNERAIRSRVLWILAAWALAIWPAAARSDVIGYSLQFSGDHNVPTIRLANTSDTASIDRLVLTIGDTSYNYDGVRNEIGSPGVGYSLITPDRNTGGAVRSNWTEYTFSGLTPGRYFQFDDDVDPDAANVIVDYRQILFDLNGANSADNALVTVDFSDGDQLSGNLPDFPTSPQDTYVFAQSTPEPATLALLAIGALGLIRRKRN